MFCEFSNLVCSAKTYQKMKGTQRFSVEFIINRGNSNIYMCLLVVVWGDESEICTCLLGSSVPSHDS